MHKHQLNTNGQRIGSSSPHRATAFQNWGPTRGARIGALFNFATEIQAKLSASNNPSSSGAALRVSLPIQG